MGGFVNVVIIPYCHEMSWRDEFRVCLNGWIPVALQSWFSSLIDRQLYGTIMY